MSDNRSFIDLTCTHCRAQWGYFGTLIERPPCPNCGYVPSKSELKEAEEVESRLEAEMLNDE